MAQNQSPLSLAQVGIRQQVCAECEGRSPGSGGGDECGREGACAVFLLLPRICDLIGRHKTEPPCGFGLAVRNLLRHAEESNAIARDPRQTPLDRHAETAVAVVQQVLSRCTAEQRAS